MIGVELHAATPLARWLRGCYLRCCVAARAVLHV